jgi:RNA polymerase sigma-70 factor (ECF subfamily)
MSDETGLIQGCIKGDNRVQRMLYQKYASQMFGVCLRYAIDEDEAADMLQEGFIKVFLKISEFRNEGSFEGWIRRIIVNTSINLVLKNKKHQFHQNLEQLEEVIEDTGVAHEQLNVKDLLKMIQVLPPGYRNVFNLYEIEGYTHKEIAELMGISVNTSKTQLMHARRLLQKRLAAQEGVAVTRKPV